MTNHIQNRIQFIGTQRSGSNLLRVMLNQHTQISAHHPPHLLKTFLPILSAYGDPMLLENRRKLVVDMCDWVGANPVSWQPVHFDIEAISNRCENIYQIMDAIYGAKMQEDGAVIWCNKSTFNINCSAQLDRELKPFYVYLYRDGRDVACSFKKAIVGPKHIYCIAKSWNEDQKKSMTFLKGIPKNRYQMIAYEALIHEPERILSELCERLSIPFQSAMLKYYESAESKQTSDSGAMWQNVTKPLMENNHHKFLSGLSEEELLVFESVAGESLRNLGYELQTAADRSFLSEEIARFQMKDAELRKEARKRSSVHDLKMREGQEKLLAKITAQLETSPAQ